MSDKLRRFTKAIYGFDAVVNRVGDDQWDVDTPCDGWKVRDVVDHQVAIMGMVAAMARGESPEINLQTEAGPGDDPRAAWADTRDELLAALDTQGALQREADTPFGHMTVDRFVGILAIDPLTHTWDIATAVGIDPALDEDLCVKGARQLERAGEMIRGPGMYGPAVAVADDADAITRFIAISGRTPA